MGRGFDSNKNSFMGGKKTKKAQKIEQNRQMQKIVTKIS